MAARRVTTIGLLAGALVLGVVSPEARAEASFADLPGDSRGAPDILSVNVSNDARGQLTFFVFFLGNVAPPADVRVTVVLDTDRNEATGSNGFDYVFQFDALNNAHAVGRWDGTAFRPFDAPTSGVDWTPLTLSFTINRSDLGGTGAFDFWIRALQGGDDSEQIDDAPNDGVWTYTLTQPKVAKATFPSPLSARAGKVLDARRVRLQLSDGTTVAPQRLTCRLTAGRVVVKPLRGGCRWQIPARLKGKTVVLTLVAGYGEDQLRVTRRLRVG